MIKLHPIIADMAKTQGRSEGFAAFMELAKPKNMATAQPLQASVSPRDKEIVAAAFSDPKELAIKEELLAKLKGLSDSERKRVLRKLILKTERELAVKNDEMARHKELLVRAKKVREVAIEVVTHLESEFVLQNASDSRFSEFRKSFNRGHILYYGGKIRTECPTLDYDTEILRNAEVFLVTHDWAAAFSDTKDLNDAPFRLPYEVCAFEFQVSGRRLIALASDIEGRVIFTMVIEGSIGWLMLDFVVDCDGMALSDAAHHLPFASIVGAQIRSICIALDAEIATTEVRRESNQGIGSKNSHTPLKKFHIVSLARRTRIFGAPGALGGRPKRLHFRRGHWRHFATFKTWVKWCLVGNPDLGFIDKQYRL